MLYVIRCGFKLVPHGPMHEGLAICSDPNTPVQFVYEDGRIHVGEIWTYTLRHYCPWAEFNMEKDNG